MNSCRECVRHALVDSESTLHAEQNSLDARSARRLFKSDTDEKLDFLRRQAPEVVKRLQERIGAVLTDDAIWTCCEHDDDYPKLFKQLHQEPKALFGVGSRDMLADLEEIHPGVAIVGARRASAYGREVAERFARELSAAGLTIVSGMALGVDGAAHRGALNAGGRTVAVLAGGVDRPYPSSHRRLYETIVAEGAVVSERPPGTEARRWGFPARNRIIAAIAKRTLFVEGTTSSGARHTVEFARELGQDPLAVPGPVTSPLSEGPNRYIVDSEAHPVIDAESVLRYVAGVELWRDATDHAGWADDDRLTGSDSGLGVVEQEVLEWIQAGETTPAAILRSARELGERDIAVALGELELAGLIDRDAAGGYSPSRKSRAVRLNHSGRSSIAT